MKKKKYKPMDYHVVEKKKYTANVFRFSQQLADIFVGFMELYIRKGYRPLKKDEIKCADLRGRYSNFHHLAYFGLIEHANGAARGDWQPTDLGVKFYNNETYIKSSVARLNNKVLSSDHPAWDTTDEVPELITLKDSLPQDFKQYEEYKEEKAGRNIVNKYE